MVDELTPPSSPAPMPELNSRLQVQLDDVLTAEQCAEWLQMEKAALMDKSKGRTPVIPGIWMNRRVVRFHVRSVLAKFAQDGGLRPELIAAMFNLPARLTSTQ